MALSDGKRKRARSEQQCRIYMDFNATTPLAPSVIEIIQDALITGWGNPSSSYECGVLAKQMIDGARKHLLTMISGTFVSEITFMSGGTEANNHVIWNALQYYDDYHKMCNRPKSKPPHIITSTIEHDSVLNVLKRLENEKKASVTYVEVPPEMGYIDPKAVVNAIRDETILVTIMMANNETGVIQKISEIGKQVKFVQRTNLPQILIHTDAAQTIGKIPVNVQELNIDFLTIVGHKFYGPRIGALWVRTGVPFFPMLLGGGQESGRRAGTENTPMIVGLGEAARLVTERLSEDNVHFSELRTHLIKALQREFKDSVKINCDIQNNLPNTVNVSFVNTQFHGRQILANCYRLAASVGAACHTNKGQQASSILLAHHVPFKEAISAVRLSIGRQTTRTDIDIVVEDLKQAVDRLKIGV